jgi:hypothetical protein
MPLGRSASPFVAVAAGVVIAAAACGPTESPTAAPSTGPAFGPTLQPSGSLPLPPRSSFTATTEAACPVTMPGPAPSAFGRLLFGSATAAGNESLWVGGLGDGGIILADRSLVEPSGAISWKLGWYRLVAGQLAISGRRLDASAPPLAASVPSGYGSSGSQASGVEFPTEGCWQLTGTVGSASLTVVTFVLRTE